MASNFWQFVTWLAHFVPVGMFCPLVSGFSLFIHTLWTFFFSFFFVHWICIFHAVLHSSPLITFQLQSTSFLLHIKPIYLVFISAWYFQKLINFIITKWCLSYCCTFFFIRPVLIGYANMIFFTSSWK